MASNNQAGAGPANSGAANQGSSSNHGLMPAATMNQSTINTSGIQAAISSIEARMVVLERDRELEEAEVHARYLDRQAILQRRLDSQVSLLSLHRPNSNANIPRAAPDPSVTAVTAAPSPGYTREEPQGTNTAMPEAGRSAARTFSQRSSDSEPDSDTATQEAGPSNQPALGPADEQQLTSVTPRAHLPARHDTVVYRGSDLTFTPAKPAYLDTEQISVKKRGFNATPTTAGPSSAPLPFATTPGPSTPASVFGMRVPTPFPNSDSNIGTTDGSITPRGGPGGSKTGSTSSTPTKPKPIMRRTSRSPSPSIDPKTYRQPRATSGGNNGSTGSKDTTGSTGNMDGGDGADSEHEQYPDKMDGDGEKDPQ